MIITPYELVRAGAIIHPHVDTVDALYRRQILGETSSYLTVSSISSVETNERSLVTNEFNVTNIELETYAVDGEPVTGWTLQENQTYLATSVLNARLARGLVGRAYPLPVLVGVGVDLQPITIQPMTPGPIQFYLRPSTIVFIPAHLFIAEFVVSTYKIPTVEVERTIGQQQSSIPSGTFV